MKEHTKRNNYTFLAFSILVIGFCLLVSFSFINKESLVMLLVFNLLFASLVFPLGGTFIRKTCLLLVGNVIGLFWNYLFYQLAFLGVAFFGEFFNIAYLILGPLANLVWIVSFWSMSLTVLAGSENKRLGIEIDN